MKTYVLLVADGAGNFREWLRGSREVIEYVVGQLDRRSWNAYGVAEVCEEEEAAAAA